MAQTSYSAIGTRASAYADMKALAHQMPIEVMAQFMMAKQIPRNATNTIKMRRANPLLPLTAPAVEGVSPLPQAISYTEISATLQQWVSVIKITDQVQDLAEDPVLSDASQLIGEQFGETFEKIRWGVARGGSSVYYANGTARNGVNTRITLGKQRAVVRFLQSMRASTLREILAPSDKIATRAIEACFVALAHTDVAADVRDLAGFIPVAQYGSRKPLCPEEIGSVENVAYVCSPLFDAFLGAGSATLNGMKATAGAVDVYPVVYLGKDALFTTVLRGDSGYNIRVINPGDIDKSDPAGQVGFVSAKGYFAAGRANELWMCRLEVGVTDL